MRSDISKGTHKTDGGDFWRYKGSGMMLQWERFEDISEVGDINLQKGTDKLVICHYLWVFMWIHILRNLFICKLYLSCRLLHSVWHFLTPYQLFLPIITRCYDNDRYSNNLSLFRFNAKKVGSDCEYFSKLLKSFHFKGFGGFKFQICSIQMLMTSSVDSISSLSLWRNWSWFD